MDVFEAIRTRRMAPKMTSQVPDRRDIEELIEAAVLAPNHHLTHPWRFIVLTAEALDGLGEVMSRRIREAYRGDPNLEQRILAERARPRRAPVIIAVIYVPSSDPLAIEVEDRYAVGAAVENMLLYARGKHLATFWRTGPAAQFEQVHEWLGLKQGEEIAGFVYVGFADPSQAPVPNVRKSGAEVTQWRGWPS
ncbi:MAG: nitroreductase [Actinomycetota bacterium]|nr:nitroreductase [Actinomycetota bacterium]